MISIKTIARHGQAVAGAALALLMCAYPLAVQATGKPQPPQQPAPPPAMASADAKAQATAQAKAAANASSGSRSSTGPVSQGVDVGGDVARSWSLFLPPPAFTPPMAPVEGCAAEVTQEAGAVTLLGSKASSRSDPSVCHLLTLRNLKVQQCQYASAKQIEDLLVARMLPGFVASPQADYLDLPRTACAMLSTPAPAEPAKPVNLIYSLAEPAAAQAAPGATQPGACPPAERAAPGAKAKANGQGSKVTKRGQQRVDMCGRILRP